MDAGRFFFSELDRSGVLRMFLGGRFETLHQGNLIVGKLVDLKVGYDGHRTFLEVVLLRHGEQANYTLNVSGYRQVDHEGEAGILIWDRDLDTSHLRLNAPPEKQKRAGVAR